MAEQKSTEQHDVVDDVLDQWRRQRPDLDASSMGIVARVQRAGRLLGLAVAGRLAEFGLEAWEFDVLATLRRAGEITAGQLARASMVTSGAMTNRVDRLVKRGLIERRPDPRSRRTILIRLSQEGREVVDAALVEHVDNLDSLTSTFSPNEREQFASLLRRLLIDLGDAASELDSSSGDS